ncbi:MAG: hypothetical protein ABR512_06085 [Desulfopila sp.]
MFFLILKNCIYLVWLLFFFWLLTWGREELASLLHPRLWWVIGTAFFIILVFLLNSVLFEKSSSGERSLSYLCSLVILLVPLGFFLVAKDAEFDAASLEKRGLQGETGFLQGNMPLGVNDERYGNSNITFSKLLRKPHSYAAQEVEIVCRTFVDEKLPENTAMCYRYLMTCCAADAIPLFVFLMHPDTLEIDNDRWITTSGTVAVIEKNGVQVPQLEITSFEYTEEPAIPWIF